MTATATNPELPSSRVGRWFYALKPASWPKLLVPTLLGQVLGMVSVGSVSLAALWLGFAFTVVGLGFIVLLNDWGDQRVDTVKREMFPNGCSPKTIPDRILSSRAVGTAGLILGLVALGCTAVAQVVLGRAHAVEAGILCMAIFAAYSLPPIRLNYRGGGEGLEMLGVGVALPLYNVYLQAGFIDGGMWPWVTGFALLSLASGIASGLSDEESDRRGGKRTLASVYGNRAARRATEACVLLGAGVWALGVFVSPEWVRPWAAAPALAVVAWRYASLRRTTEQAVTNAFDAQGRYKRFLHGAIWHSTGVAAFMLWLGMVS
ncbi:MAG: prenyltransferase [Myxococcota bacterium]